MSYNSLINQPLMPYLITYDLNRPMQDYTVLIAAISSLTGAFRYQQSSWLVMWSGSSVQLRDGLKALMDADDSLLVNRVDAAAWSDRKITTWMQTMGIPITAAA